MDKKEEPEFTEGKIVERDVESEMRTAYIDYAMSVLVLRALPDVRDGLKPVHRRILYTMYEDGLTTDKPYRKSATTVGDVLGRYHPHGDSSVYDAMVRMAQDFSLRYPLIDGHGNFGSIDGDGAAAYRYTEARMSKIAETMLTDIEKDTVDFMPNFDGIRQEPTVLPGKLPALLVNGSSGIAVGMATNIPPHNLTEILNAIIKIIESEEDLSDEELFKIVKGPDFPTGGLILGRDGIKQAYATGKGKITLRAEAEIEEMSGNKQRIIVTSLPYQVNKAKLIMDISQLVRDRKIEGISEVRDESDREEKVRVVIELKRDVNSKVILNQLYKYTQMQDSFGIIMLALVNNEPKILTLRQCLDYYIDHRKTVVLRRTKFDLDKALARAHILEGLRIAIDNIDEVIKIIRESYDDAKERLMERFGLDDIQAQAILDMRLKTLSGLQREKIEEEYAQLMELIAHLREILSSDKLVYDIIKEECLEMKEKYGDERLTKIVAAEGEFNARELYEAINLKYAIDYSLNNLNKFDIELIIKIGDLINKNIKDTSGFRKTQNYIQGADFVPVKPSYVPSMINDIIYEYNNSELDILFKIAKFHIDFEHIHPFRDGNGRTGRVLLNHQLIMNNEIPIVIPEEKRLEYFDILANFDIDGFVKLIKDLQKREKEKMNDYGVL